MQITKRKETMPICKQLMLKINDFNKKKTIFINTHESQSAVFKLHKSIPIACPAANATPNAVASRRFERTVNNQNKLTSSP